MSDVPTRHPTPEVVTPGVVQQRTCVGTGGQRNDVRALTRAPALSLTATLWPAAGPWRSPPSSVPSGGQLSSSQTPLEVSMTPSLAKEPYPNRFVQLAVGPVAMAGDAAQRVRRYRICR